MRRLIVVGMLIYSFISVFRIDAGFPGDIIVTPVETVSETTEEVVIREILIDKIPDPVEEIPKEEAIIKGETNIEEHPPVNDRLGKPVVVTEVIIEEEPVFELDAYILSNLDAEDFDKILLNTPLEGLGYAFVKVEEEYGVNGLFAISVCQLESGLGKYQANKNNFFGFYYNGRYMSFDTPEKGILYFGKLISGSIYAGRSIDSIAKTYCPPNPKWAPTVKQIMKENWNKAV